MMLLALAVVAAGTSFTCTPISVWDGDGPIKCAEGPKIRLAAIAAREVRWTGTTMVDAGCRRHHPCGPAAGPDARDALVRLIGTARGTSADGHVLVSGAPLRCRSLGSGLGERTAAWCATAAGIDLSCAMVTGGYAVRWPAFDRDRRLCR